MMDSIDADLLKLVNQVRRHKSQADVMALRGDLRLRDDLQFDSLDLAELTVRIEEKFGVDVFEEGVVQHWHEIRERVVRHATSRK
jgi:acyl carrier protein